MERLVEPIEQVKKSVEEIIKPLETVREPPSLQTSIELLAIIAFVERKLISYFSEVLKGKDMRLSFKVLSERITHPMVIDPSRENLPLNDRGRKDFKLWCNSFDGALQSFLRLLEYSDYLTGKVSEPITDYSEIEIKNLVLTKLSKLYPGAHYFVWAILSGNGYVSKYHNYTEDLAATLEKQGLVSRLTGTNLACVKLTIDGRMYVEEILEKAKRLKG
jgi:hypothetical protein